MSVLLRIPYWAVLVLLVYMPFHVFLAQSLSLATSGLETWKIAKDIILFSLLVFTFCLVWIKQQQRSPLLFWMTGLAAAYALLHALLWVASPDIFEKSAILGSVYNLRLPTLLFLGYGAVVLHPDKFVFSSVLKVVLGVSTVVALLGLIQYFLPPDFLTHLGYGLDRGTRAAFFIDDNQHLPRIMSTLREPNALGAYLILPFTAITLLFLRLKNQGQRLLLGGMWLLHAVALLLTFSRSAWLGAVLSLGLVVWWHCRLQLAGLARRWWPLLLVGVGLVTILVVSQRNNQFVQSYITHSTPEAVEDLDSNDYHWLLVRRGIEGVVDQPLGHGPGTAGIVSIQNPGGGVLTENYYVQIAYEVGIIGLALFIALSAFVYVHLLRRHDYVMAILLASFWGYVLTNMLLHTWSNEAVAAQWWLLAGMALVIPKKQKKSR